MKAKEHNLNTEVYKCIKAINIENLNKEDKRELLRIFLAVENPLIRNHIAMIFSDLEYHDAVPFIIEKIADKDVKDNGTLIYALENLDSKKYFLSFIKMICEMDYEARLMAYELVYKYVESIPRKTIVAAIEILKTNKKRLKESASSDKGDNSALHFIEKTHELLLKRSAF